MKTEWNIPDIRSIYSENAKTLTTVNIDSFIRTSLDKAAKGNSVIITGLPEGETAAQLIRLGLTVGRAVKCIDRLPGGTIILQNRRQEIAIGQKLAENISIVI